MTTFRTLSRLTLGLLLSLGTLWSSSYAIELDSTNITSAPFNCSTGATSCDLSYQNITSIASGTFVDHTNLTTLWLSDNQITSIESADFAGLYSLTTLYLGYTQITSIESGDFAGLSSLTYLGLPSNQITSIESGDFAGLYSLTSLDLNSNQITSIESGDFAGLSSLTILGLSSNQITSIENGDFSGLSSLTYLELAGNQITSIESGDFIGLSSLTYLGLPSNQITSIESGDFSGLSNLTELILEGNQISSIESGDFSELTSLSSLALNGNQITSIESGDFAGLTSLSRLYLGGNQITSIESGDFTGLSSLSYLELYGNQITSIESEDFAGLTSLTELDLYGNQITSIEAGDFTELTSLSNLNLSANQITSIESGSFAGFPDLQLLYLSLNCLNTDDNLVTDYLDTLPWIDYSNQLICLQTQYSPSTSTSGSVTGSLSFVGPASLVAVLSGENPDMTLYDHVFTGNGSHLYDYSSMIDSNTYLWSRYMTNGEGIPSPDTVLGSVTWIIDTTPPLGTLTYSTTGITNQSVTATLSLNESGSVTNNSGSSSYIFSGNGAFIFEYQDNAGNTGATTASVTWIDTTAPTITLNGSGTLSGYVGTSYTDAGASWTDAVAGSGTLIGSGIVDTSLTGTYIISYSVTDTAGNTSTANRTVTILPVVIIPPVVTSPRSSGGGGGGSLSIDTCPGGDYSSSYYDRSCGTKPTAPAGVTIPQNTTQNTPKRPIPSILTDNNDDNIITQTTNTVNTTIKAYERSSSVGITTADTVQEARLDTTITRAELAKMMSIYATDVLDKEYTISETACEFEDADQANKGLVSYIRQACQLGIMGLQSDGQTPLTKFNPNRNVTRAEFATVLSRVLYGDLYNTDSTQWREGHLENLKEQDIITINNPKLHEKRGWVMTMLYRTVQE